MNGPMGPMQRQQLEGSLQYLKAKLKLHERRLQADRTNAQAERQLVKKFYALLIYSGDKLPDQDPSLGLWIKAHAEHAEARTELLELEIADLKAQISVTTAMIAHLDQIVVVPRGTM